MVGWHAGPGYVGPARMAKLLKVLMTGVRRLPKWGCPILPAFCAGGRAFDAVGVAPSCSRRRAVHRDSISAGSS